MLKNIFRAKTEEEHKKNIADQETKNEQAVDMMFAGLVEIVKRSIPRMLNDVDETENVYTIKLPLAWNKILSSGRENIVASQVNYYAHNLDKKDLSNSLVVKSEGFLELHRVCKENDYCLQIKPRETDKRGVEIKPARIEIKFSESDRYADSTDANFWKDKAGVVKPLAPKGRVLAEGETPKKKP